MHAADLQRLETVALAVAGRHFGAELLQPSRLADQVRRLSEAYTVGREAWLEEQARRRRAPGVVASEAALLARLLFFMVQDAPKLAVPVRQARQGGLLASPGGGRWLDLGAGTGSTTAGAWLELAGEGLAPPSVILVEREARALALAGEVAEGLGLRPTLVKADLESLRGGSTSLVEGSFELVLLGQVLNELGASRAPELVLWALGRLTPGGALIIVEPATREITRQLHRVRDDLLATGRVRAVAPCLRQGPCPMLTRERDWCHEDLPALPMPELAAELVERTGLRQRRLKFSYLVLARPEAPGLVVHPPGRTWRATSDAVPSKGKLEVDLCGEAGLVRTALLRRHRDAGNRAFGEVRRGALVRLPVLLRTPSTEAEGPPRLQGEVPAGVPVEVEGP